MGKLKSIVPHSPGQMWGVDVVGPLPPTQVRNHYFLVDVDYGT